MAACVTEDERGRHDSGGQEDETLIRIPFLLEQFRVQDPIHVPFVPFRAFGQEPGRECTEMSDKHLEEHDHPEFLVEQSKARKSDANRTSQSECDGDDGEADDGYSAGHN